MYEEKPKKKHIGLIIVVSFMTVWHQVCCIRDSQLVSRI